MKQVKGSNGHLGPRRANSKRSNAGNRIPFTLVFVLFLLFDQLRPRGLTPLQQGQHQAVIDLRETVAVH